jgi:hypothetical protein
MFFHLSAENWLLAIAFITTVLYSNWLVGEAEKQKSR